MATMGATTCVQKTSSCSELIRAIRQASESAADGTRAAKGSMDGVERGTPPDAQAPS
jgi:hypothetical protein